MEKTIEILLVATVVLMTAVVVIFMFQGRIGSFDDFLEGQSDDAKCDIGEVKYRNTAECEEGQPQNTRELDGIEDDYSQCETSDWEACPTQAP